MYLIYIERVSSIAQKLKEGVFPHGINGINRPDALWLITPNFGIDSLSKDPIKLLVGSISRLAIKHRMNSWNGLISEPVIRLKQASQSS